MFTGVLLRLLGETNNKTNNRNGEIHPCFAMYSDVEMPLCNAAKDHPCMRFSLDDQAVPHANSKKQPKPPEHLNWPGPPPQLPRLRSAPAWPLSRGFRVSTVFCPWLREIFTTTNCCNYSSGMRRLSSGCSPSTSSSNSAGTRLSFTDNSCNNPVTSGDGARDKAVR